MLVDEFSLEVNLHHPSCDPREITQELSLDPWFAVRNGANIGDVIHRKTTLLCHFRGGTTNPEFTRALEDTASLLSNHQGFIFQFVAQGGEVEVVLNSAIDSGFVSGDKLSELTLHPWFLSRLAENDIHLRLQVWVADSDKK